jgi:hypothetical protein
LSVQVLNGVIACIIPARSAWDRRFITALARRCYAVRAWKFPNTGDIENKAGFERYSQIVVIGYKRQQQLPEADERDIVAMQQWRYVRDPQGEHQGYPWPLRARNDARHTARPRTPLNTHLRGLIIGQVWTEPWSAYENGQKESPRAIYSKAF